MNKLKGFIPVIIFAATLLLGAHSLMVHGHKSASADISLISSPGLKRVATYVLRRTGDNTNLRIITIRDHRRAPTYIFTERLS
ncbi:MAG: hypothetical protein HRU20_20680 [Pseudomonadales bacterium]|nr:hypothetical protein [Pseudomonadales bacterium]